MNDELLLPRLGRVRKTGVGRYISGCPAHKDKTPSLSIRFADDGRILMHCFAGCRIEDVVSAIGLTVSDLFPDRPKVHSISSTRSSHLKPSEALLLLGHEVAVIAIVLEELLEILKAGRTPSDLAMDRLYKAFGRINSVRYVTDEGTEPEIRELRRGVV
jgi:hypothetical protein